jgi:hypothetical protein
VFFFSRELVGKSAAVRAPTTLTIVEPECA